MTVAKRQADLSMMEQNPSPRERQRGRPLYTNYPSCFIACLDAKHRPAAEHFGMSERQKDGLSCTVRQTRDRHRTAHNIHSIAETVVAITVLLASTLRNVEVLTAGQLRDNPSGEERCLWCTILEGQMVSLGGIRNFAQHTNDYACLVRLRQTPACPF